MIYKKKSLIINQLSLDWNSSSKLKAKNQTIKIFQANDSKYPSGWTIKVLKSYRIFLNNQINYTEYRNYFNYQN